MKKFLKQLFCRHEWNIHFTKATVERHFDPEFTTTIKEFVLKDGNPWVVCSHCSKTKRI